MKEDESFDDDESQHRRDPRLHPKVQQSRSQMKTDLRKFISDFHEEVLPKALTKMYVTGIPFDRDGTRASGITIKEPRGRASKGADNSEVSVVRSTGRRDPVVKNALRRFIGPYVEDFMQALRGMSKAFILADVRLLEGMEEWVNDISPIVVETFEMGSEEMFKLFLRTDLAKGNVFIEGKIPGTGQSSAGNALHKSYISVACKVFADIAGAFHETAGDMNVLGYFFTSTCGQGCVRKFDGEQLQIELDAARSELESAREDISVEVHEDDVWRYAYRNKGNRCMLFHQTMLIFYVSILCQYNILLYFSLLYILWH